MNYIEMLNAGYLCVIAMCISAWAYLEAISGRQRFIATLMFILAALLFFKIGVRFNISWGWK